MKHPVGILSFNADGFGSLGTGCKYEGAGPYLLQVLNGDGFIAPDCYVSEVMHMLSLQDLPVIFFQAVSKAMLAGEDPVLGQASKFCIPVQDNHGMALL
jgi:hypothetical protein